MSALPQADPPTQTKPAKSLGRLVLGAALVLCLTVSTAYLALRYVIWPNLEWLRPTIVAHLTELAGRPVSMSAIETGFDGLQPQLVVSNLAIDGPDGSPALRVPRARIV